MNAKVLQGQSQMHAAVIAVKNAKMSQGQDQIKPPTVEEVKAIKEGKCLTAFRQDQCKMQVH